MNKYNNNDYLKKKIEKETIKVLILKTILKLQIIQKIVDLEISLLKIRKIINYMPAIKRSVT